MQGYAPGDAGGALVDVNLDSLAASLPAGVEMTSYSIGATACCAAPSPTTCSATSASSPSPTSPTPPASSASGETAFRATANSGTPELGVAGQGSRGDLMGGTLEMSNVDLSAEFTNLILAQRGFQASSRVITTSDQVLEELVNIKR